MRLQIRGLDIPVSYVRATKSLRWSMQPESRIVRSDWWYINSYMRTGKFAMIKT